MSWLGKQQQESHDAALTKALQQEFEDDDNNKTTKPPPGGGVGIATVATATNSSFDSQDATAAAGNNVGQGKDEAKLVAALSFSLGHGEYDVDKDTDDKNLAKSSSIRFHTEERKVAKDIDDDDDDTELEKEKAPDTEGRRKQYQKSRSVRQSFYKYSGYVFPITEEGKCTRPERRHYISLSILILLCLGCVFGLIYHFVILGGDADDVVDALEDLTGVDIDGDGNNDDFAKTDPFNSDGQPKSWSPNVIDSVAKREGLQMRVLNALQSKWDEFFTAALQDWDNGQPDALDLLPQDAEYDFNCTPILGVVKVCNGNYGATGWRGLVDYSLVDGQIVAVRARMNENYTGDPLRDADEMRYVMCHELGHCWGLVHSDENYENEDIGDCLEYTRTPANSKSPGRFQFDILFDLYGLVPGAAPFTPPTAAPTGVRRALLEEKQEATTIAKGQNDTTESRHPSRQLSQEQEVPLPPRLRSSAKQQLYTNRPLVDHTGLEEVYHHLSGEILQPDQWKTLQQNEFSELHHLDLPNGKGFRVYKLLA